ncbi:hypothetical protein ACRXCV_14380 [Halobacteriovorax sp. GFR7]|uniref:hypothetical protein n=1 Tax=unclassified Halobacteriovorax TaxID=2639665 RepID=UPI003D983DEF
MNTVTIRQKIFNKVKRKQLNKKFSGVNDLKSQEKECEESLETSLETFGEANNDEKISVKFSPINWQKNLTKDSYSQWVFDTFYKRLQLYLKENFVTIESKRFVKNKEDRKRLELVLKVDNLPLKENIVKQLTRFKVQPNLSFPKFQRISNSSLSFKTIFDIIEDHDETNTTKQAASSKKQSKSPTRSRKVYRATLE